MAKDIKVNGVEYEGAKTVDIPLADGSGMAHFYETSGDTTPDKVLAGEVYHRNGTELGTMPNNGTVNGVIKNKNDEVPIAEGYHDGNGSVSLDPYDKEMLVPENLMLNRKVLGVLGNGNIGSEVAAWLAENVTQVDDPVIDASLLVAGAAADAAAAGKRISSLEAESVNLLDNRAVQVWTGQEGQIGVNVTRTGFNAFTLPGETIANGRVFVRLTLKTNTKYTLAFNKHRDTSKAGSNGTVRIMEWDGSSYVQLAGAEFVGEDDVWKVYSFTTSDTGNATVTVRVTFCVTKVSDNEAGDVVWRDVMLLEGDVSAPTFIRHGYAQDDEARMALEATGERIGALESEVGQIEADSINLLDNRTAKIVSGHVSDMDISITDTGFTASAKNDTTVLHYGRAYVYLALTPNTAYTLACVKHKTLMGNTSVRVQYKENGSWGNFSAAQTVIPYNAPDDERVVGSFTTNGTGEVLLNFLVTYENSGNAPGGSVTWSDVMLIEGSVALEDYPPYVGYKYARDDYARAQIAALQTSVQDRYPGAPFGSVLEVYEALDAIKDASDGRITMNELGDPLDDEEGTAVRMRLYTIDTDPRYMKTPGYTITAGEVYEKPKALIIATQHGDERTNARVLVDLIHKLLWDEEYASVAAGFKWYIIPVVNVYGYNHNQRANADGRNINRDYTENPYVSVDDGKSYGFETVEANIIKELYLANEFSLFLDLHNTDNDNYSTTDVKLGFTSLIPREASPDEETMGQFKRLWRVIQGVNRSAEAWVKNDPNTKDTDQQFCFLWARPDTFTTGNAASAPGYIRGNANFDPDYASHHPVLCSVTVETGRYCGLFSKSSEIYNRAAMSFSAVYVEGMVKALGEAVLDMYPNI